MGRHAAYQPTYTERANTAFDRWLETKNLRRPKLPVLPRGKLRPLHAFLSSVALVLVTAVDPYSGSMMSAFATDFSFASNAPSNQAIDVITPVSVNFARGGFTVLTPAETQNLFVEDAGTPSAGTAKAFAFRLSAQLGWGQDQYSCLVKLWERESNWRVNAQNSSSGAYGIPQALPGNKMASEGIDWMSNAETQIRWGVKYIKSRYKNPCSALVHSNQVGWY